MRKSLLFFAFLLGACSAQNAGGSNISLDPYHTVAPSLTPAPNVIVIVQTPQPTSTPFVYTILEGDTFSQLAERFKISQDELRAANPNVSPNSMPVGGTLLVPDSSPPLAAAPTPSPAPVPVSQIICHPSADSGLWCFALIKNNTPDLLENVSAQITLLDENNNALASQTAFTPLNIIPSNASLPVYVFFPNMPANLTPQARMLSAVQLSAQDSRYLPTKLSDIITQISWNGLVAQARGQVSLPAESTAASQVWVAAVAYDSSGRVIGLKRWEGGALQSGGGINFSFTISSLASAIDSVQFFVEAR